VDNRQGVQAGNCLILDNAYPQDNITGQPVYLFRYTDSEPATGCVVVRNFNVALNPSLANGYFNGNLSVNGVAQSTVAPLPSYLNAPSASYSEGGRTKTEVENEGASFGPQIVPYGSLPMFAYSVSAWNALCVTATTCTGSSVVGPDGPSGQMVAWEMDTSSFQSNIQIGYYSGTTYSGDHFIIWSWVRPGLNNANTWGVIAGTIGAENGFYLDSGGTSGTFAPTQNTAGNTSYCAPGAFGTQLQVNGWGMETAICTVVGGSAPYFHFNLATSNRGTGTAGSQFAEPGWAFIPGPNNPACTAAGTCNLSADQIEFARQSQYHGFVPPGVSAGVAATGEAVQSSVGFIATSPTALTDSSSVTWSTAGVNVSATLTLTTGTTLNLSRLAAGQFLTLVTTGSGYSLTGGTGCTWLVGGSSGFSASTTLMSSSNAADAVAIFYDGTSCWANVR
jgi:hypothetical protein